MLRSFHSLHLTPLRLSVAARPMGTSAKFTGEKCDSSYFPERGIRLISLCVPQAERTGARAGEGSGEGIGESARPGGGPLTGRLPYTFFEFHAYLRVFVVVGGK